MTTLPFALYRYFDEAGRPLYFGMTGNLSVREQSHISGSPWMELAASSTIQRYGTESEVRTAERAAIKADQPLFNNRQNRSPESWDRLVAYLSEIDRMDLLPPNWGERPVRRGAVRARVRRGRATPPGQPRMLTSCDVLIAATKAKMRSRAGNRG